MNKRRTIIDAFQARITAGYPTVKIRRGNPGQPVTHFPSIYLFEDTERRVKQNKILYRVTLPLITEYFFQSAPGDSFYAAGNQKLEEFLGLLDYDTDLDGICHEFGVVEAEIIEFRDGVCDVWVLWEFVYDEAKIVNPS